MTAKRSNRLAIRGLVGAVIGLAMLASAARAQQVPKPAGPPLPRVFTVFPMGGRPGTAVELTVTGIDIDEPEGLLFSRPGIKAEPIEPKETKPEPATTKNQRRGGLRGLGPLTAKSFRISIPEGLKPETIDVRLVNRWGVSNPRAFVIGDLEDAVELEPNEDVLEADRVAVGTTINGFISSPTDVDDFVFEGRAGQRILISGLASSIDSRLLLALELFDESGKRLAANHEYRGTDALLDVVLPATGDYLLRAFCFTYSKGGPDHFYRVSVSTAPWIDAAFPPVVESGKKTDVILYGRNLPGGKPDNRFSIDNSPLEMLKATVEAPADGPRLDFGGLLLPGSSGLDGFEYRIKSSAGTSNPYLITLAKAPVVIDSGSNDSPESAQPIAPPVEIAGWVETRRDRDWYAFSAKKGDVLSLEGLSARLGSPVDLYLAVRNAQSKQIIGEFDEENNARNPIRRQEDREARNQFFTRTFDPGCVRFVAPADGRYELLVASRESAAVAGPRQLYRVRVTPERPDFRLVVMPTSTTYPDALVLRRGGETEAVIHVWRDDGFNDEITLSAEDLPPGVTCPFQVIGTGQFRGSLILSAAADAPVRAGSFRVKGTAMIGDRTIVREARSATITWPVPPQQNIPTISRLDRSLALAVRDEASFRLTADKSALDLTHGDKGKIALALHNREGFQGSVQTTVAPGVPEALASAVKLSMNKNGGEAVVESRPNIAPGVYTLFFQAQGQVPMTLDPKRASKTDVTVLQPSTPVIVSILPRELAKVSVNPQRPTVKPGNSVNVRVRVARQFGYAGPFEVTLAVPDKLDAVHAEPLTIPAGKDEGTWTIAASSQAKPGTHSGLVAHAVAKYRDKRAISQEASFSLIIDR